MEKILWVVAIGCVGAYIAKKRKLNPFFWFAVCFMLGLTALVGFIFFPFFSKKWKKKPAPTQSEPKLLPSFPLQSLWYHLDEQDNQQGPISFTKLQELILSGEMKTDTYVWNESFDSWKPIKNIFAIQTEK